MLAMLVMLQVLIGTLGQGALTLCVRRDGTQHLEWTALSDCKAEAARASDPCCLRELDEVAAISAAQQFHCDPCTDHVLIADQVVVLTNKSAWLDDQPLVCLHGLDSLPVAWGQSAGCVVSYHAPPRAGPGTYLSSVVIRC